MEKLGYHESIKALKKPAFKVWYLNTRKNAPDKGEDWEAQYNSLHPKESPKESK